MVKSQLQLHTAIVVTKPVTTASVNHSQLSSSLSRDHTKRKPKMTLIVIVCTPSDSHNLITVTEAVIMHGHAVSTILQLSAVRVSFRSSRRFKQRHAMFQPAMTQRFL